MSVFARLGFNPSITVTQNLSSNATNTMSMMPDILNDWQTTDIANSDATGYFVNPCRVVTQSIWNTANSIVAITGLSSVSNASSIYTTSQALQAAANNFMLHTDRISGMTRPNADTATKPHYATAIGLGKVVMQITFQTDGVQNNAPMMGNFTSLFAKSDLEANNTTISGYPTLVSTNMHVTSDFGDPPELTYTTSLTPTQVTTITNGLQATVDLLNSRRTSDENFFANTANVINDYNTLKQFSNPGQTESYLLNNYIGSTKLLSRLNS